MRKIAGAFRTTPIPVLESELAIPPVNNRLDNLHRKYAARTIRMPLIHPIHKQLPESFPGSGNVNVEEEGGTPGNCKGKQYNKQLERILQTISDWIQPEDDLEVTQYNGNARWEKIKIKMYLGNKAKE